MKPLSDVVCAAYLADTFALLALADRLATLRPLARAFVLLSSVALVGLVVGQQDTNAHAYTRTALHALAPAACAWAVMSTARERHITLAPFAFVAACTWLGATHLPTDETVVQFVRVQVPSWQRAAALYWFGVWIGWSVAAVAGLVWWVRAPIRIAHVVAGLVAISVATESIGLVAWAAHPRGYELVLGVDLMLALVVGALASWALRRVEP